MVTKRKKIGIVFTSDDIGVVYYLVNIVRTLDYLTELEKPEIIVFFNIVFIVIKFSSEKINELRCKGKSRW